MEFLVVTRTPSRMGLMGFPIPEKITIERLGAESLEALVEEIHAPLYGECLIVPEEHVTEVESRIINEVKGK